jgi:hypothetical protein
MKEAQTPHSPIEIHERNLAHIIRQKTLWKLEHDRVAGKVHS